MSSLAAAAAAFVSLPSFYPRNRHTHYTCMYASRITESLSLDWFVIKPASASAFERTMEIQYRIVLSYKTGVPCPFFYTLVALRSKSGSINTLWRNFFLFLLRSFSRGSRCCLLLAAACVMPRATRLLSSFGS